MKKGHYLFTSESVSEGHPDKMCDQISDALLDEYLHQDRKSRVAIECFATRGQLVIAGEVTSNARVNVDEVARKVINSIGYTKSEYMFSGDSVGILTSIHEQSPDINQGVDREKEEEQGAGDQGIMFGYATNETPLLIPFPLMVAHEIVKELAYIRKHESSLMPYLRPDTKSQVTVEYDENDKIVHIDSILISTQHDENVDQKTIENDIRKILIPVLMKLHPQLREYIDEDTILYVNPTGKFVIGGAAGDTGLTGRKIVVDTYGGIARVGGGCFSGKDASKVDRSFAYFARYLAKNCVKAGIADKMEIQYSTAIGIAHPLSINVNTFETSYVDMTDGELAEKLLQFYPITPAYVIKKFGLLNPIYSETAAYGHFGRLSEKVTKTFSDGKSEEVELFPWEKLDAVELLKERFF